MPLELQNRKTKKKKSKTKITVTRVDAVTYDDGETSDKAPESAIATSLRFMLFIAAAAVCDDVVASVVPSDCCDDARSAVDEIDW